MTKCTHWFGHKFEGRYSRREGQNFQLEGGQTLTPELIEAASDIKTYERDICVRCGATVEKVK